MNTSPESPSSLVAGDSPATDVAVTLGMLSAIEGNSAHSQRSLAGELGIALGLANALLKRCVRKGWVKVQQVPANRYSYYLTPQGFAEKARLTGEYVSASLSFFRRARMQAEDVLERAGRSGAKRLVLIGAGDLAEIAILAAQGGSCRIVAIVDPNQAGGQLAGIPIVASLSEGGRFDAALITDSRTPQTSYDACARLLGSQRVLTLDLLRIRREEHPTMAVEQVWP